ILLILIFIALGYIAYIPFHNYPFCMDEYNYLYQAEIFSMGKIFIEVPDRFRPFVETYVLLKDDRLFSKYPPGFPLILSLGVLLNISGIINPLVALITLIILYSFATTFCDTKYGLLAVILMSTTPYFLAYSASYFSQPTALLLTAIIFFLVRKFEITSRDSYLPLLGFFSGFLFLTRPLDAFCAMMPAYLYLSYILFKKNSLNKILYPILTFMVIFTLFLTYNYFLIGKISIATYPIVEGEFKIVDPDANGFFQNLRSISKEYFMNGIKYIPGLLTQYLLIPAGLFVPLLAIFGFFKFRSPWKWVLISNYLMLILFYNFHHGYGWPLYGARYYYSGFFSMVVFAVISSKIIIETLKNKAYVFYLLTFVLGVHIILTFTLFNEYSYRFDIRKSFREEVKRECPDNSIIVLSRNNTFNTLSSEKACQNYDFRTTGKDKISPVANERMCKSKVKFVNADDEKRNPFMSSSQLITINDKYLNLEQIRSDFPNRSICIYEYDPRTYLARML
ncbi:MAG: glycosyltransferase family 39 protein, partial [Nitrospirota bacterium]